MFNLCKKLFGFFTTTTQPEPIALSPMKVIDIELSEKLSEFVDRIELDNIAEQHYFRIYLIVAYHSSVEEMMSANTQMGSKAPEAISLGDYFYDNPNIKEVVNRIMVRLEAGTLNSRQRHDVKELIDMLIFLLR